MFVQAPSCRHLAEGQLTANLGLALRFLILTGRQKLLLILMVENDGLEDKRNILRVGVQRNRLFELGGYFGVLLSNSLQLGQRQDLLHYRVQRCFDWLRAGGLGTYLRGHATRGSLPLELLLELHLLA